MFEVHWYQCWTLVWQAGNGGFVASVLVQWPISLVLGELELEFETRTKAVSRGWEKSVLWVVSRGMVTMVGALKKLPVI